MNRHASRVLLTGVVGVAAVALVVGGDDLWQGVLVGVLGAVLVLALTLWCGRRGKHTPWEQASALPAPNHAVVLWKPGCVHCERLLLQLGRDPRVTWVNVWQDEAARAQVCALNGGDELTPTVLVGEEVLRNPTARELRQRWA